MKENRHIIVDLFDVPDNSFVNILSKSQFGNFDIQIEQLLRDNHMTCLGKFIHHFDDTNGALTCLYCLAESHLSFHTWPERNYISLDCYTCGACDTQNVVNEILYILKPQRAKQVFIQRGDTETKNITHNLIWNESAYDMYRDIEDKLTLFSLMYQNHKIIEEKQTEYQRLTITENDKLGICLFLDDTLQISSRDIDTYNIAMTNEMMNHFNNKTNLRILVIGGGDGYLTEHLLQHYNNQIKHIDIVELDEEVAKYTDKYFRNGKKWFDDNDKITYMNDFGDKFIKITDNIYDGILIDCTDYNPASPSCGLFSPEFYADCAKHLNSNGFITQQYSETNKFLDNTGTIVFPVIPENFVGNFTDKFIFSYGVPLMFLNMKKQ